MKKAGLNFSFDNYIMKYWNLFNPFYKFEFVLRGCLRIVQ